MEARKARAEADSLREWKQEKQGQKQTQIPCGNDKRKEIEEF